MAIETQAPISRRGLFAAVLGGTAAAIAGVASRAERAFAAGSDGETVVVGGTYDDVRTVTRFQRTSDAGPMFIFGTPDDGVQVRAGDNPRIWINRGGDDRGAAFTRLEPDSLFTPRLESNFGEFNGGVIGYSKRSRPGVTGRTLISSGNVFQPGVLGDSPRSTGVRGTGARGGDSRGAKAPLRMRPSKKATHPTSGAKGDFFVDRSGRLWFCRGGTNWTRLA